ncbi:DUF4180 domain-containing protein [Paenibacillus tyrfis]|uniref:DUF4180 domain-containing protein n=1 Tax=Paenibacillus tyrfis TaxID=1501230 RepID=UPI0035CCF378
MTALVWWRHVRNTAPIKLCFPRVAGQVMPVNYNIKAVAVIDTKIYRGKFSDFIAEANRGKWFHAFEDLDQADSWLIEEEK